MTNDMDQKSEATFFKEEVENSIKRYGNMTVYETIGALEVVKKNLLERLGWVGKTNGNDDREPQ